MAQLVLGLGVSHSPMLNAEASDWLLFEERDRTRQHLDKNGDPISFEELERRAGPSVRERLTPASFADRFAQAMAGLDKVRAALADARLDVLIVIGDDQRELFDDRNMPSILIYRGETIRNVPLDPNTPGPDWSRRLSARYYEAEAARDYPVDAGLAEHLIGRAMEGEFDVACADALEEGKGEGHAFGFVHKRIVSDPALPIVPVFLNTYYPPNQPSPRRCYEFGKMLGAAVRDFPKDRRIGILASGGLSHFTVDEELDQDVVRALRDKDADVLRTLPVRKLNGGSSEIRNWICAAGALETLPIDEIDYVPGYRTSAGTGTGLCFAVWRAR